MQNTRADSQKSNGIRCNRNRSVSHGTFRFAAYIDLFHMEQFMQNTKCSMWNRKKRVDCSMWNRNYEER